MRRKVVRIVNPKTSSKPVSRHIIKVLGPRVSTTDRKAFAVPLIYRDLERVVAGVQTVHPAVNSLEVLNWPSGINIVAVLRQRQAGVVDPGTRIPTLTESECHGRVLHRYESQR